MSINYLYAAATIAATLLIARLLTPIFSWHMQKALLGRRAKRRRGYVPAEVLRREIRFFDDDWSPR